MTQLNLLWLIIWFWLIICAFFDWRKGEVPNWLTLPGMAAGIVYVIAVHPERLIFLGVAFVALIGLFLLKGLGGADVKVLTALAGLWPLAMIVALLVQGIWGLLVLIRKGRGAEFKAIPAYALGAVLATLLLL
jgi:prepilin peptidase CpaA